MRQGTPRGLTTEYFENHPNQEIEDHVVMKWGKEEAITLGSCCNIRLSQAT